MKRYPKPIILDQIPLQRDAVIEASAGTGKTYTLEHLIVEILLNGGGPHGRHVPIDKILIVTYTERATIELRERVRGILEKILGHDDNSIQEPYWLLDANDLKFLERQLFAFEKAPIHTIHGFCRRVLSENAFHMRRLFDQAHVDSKIIFERAFKRALREQLARDPNLKPYLEAWLAVYNIEKLANDLAEVIRTTAIVRPRWDESKFREAARKVARANIDWQKWARQNDGSFGRPDEASERRFQNYIKIAQTCQRLTEFNNLAEALIELNPFIDELKKKPDDHGELNDLINHAASVRVATLQSFKNPVAELLNTEKARGFFDFDDMLRMVWERLDDHDDPNTKHLITLLRGQYRFALVDEFQDTDEIQWNIFKRLFFESPDNRLFVIGDPKQAIYSFRGADVTTYLEAKKTIVEGDDTRTIQLLQNFRSTPDLITAYNRIFEHSSADDSFFKGKIAYRIPVSAGHPNARAYTPDGRTIVPIRLVNIQGDQLRVGRVREIYGKFIALEIKKILSEKWQIDDGQGNTRVIEPQDIYILTRSRSEEKTIGQYLRALSVPFSFYKLEGLYQTPEAYEVLDLLRAIDEPHVEEHRLRAWGTAFFGLDLQQLGECRDLPETDALVDRLVYWHEIAQARDFERLFTDILDRSGIIRREIFFNESERELTNYLHILEQLVEESHASSMDMAELVQRLHKWVTAQEAPEGEDKNIQRLESERAAVQVMTMHKSKGLEADVVFIYGGFTKSPADFVDLHFRERRIKHIGSPLHSEAIQAARAEERDENSRLLYVAVTRARAKVYMPYFEKGVFRSLEGTYTVLNSRLSAIRGNLPAGLFEVMPISEESMAAQNSFSRSVGVSFVLPKPQTPPQPVFTQYPSLRGRGLLVSSYSRLKAAKGGYRTAVDVEEFKTEASPEPDAWRQEIELPGGTGPGVFMHALLEEIPFFSVNGLTLEQWADLPEIRQKFDEIHRRFAIESKYQPFVQRLIYHTLNTPITLPEGPCRIADITREKREVEFVFPIPENSHIPLTHPVTSPSQSSKSFTIERGWIKGFIDLMFEFEGRVYFADWKTDTLHAYHADALNTHVALNYDMQARLYSLAVARLYGLRDAASFEEKFGGYVYFFLRGIRENGDGIYARRPSFDDVCEFEKTLIEVDYT